MAPAGHPGDPQSPPPRRPRRHDPTFPDFLRDLCLGPQEAAQAGRSRVGARRRRTHHVQLNQGGSVASGHAPGCGEQLTGEEAPMQSLVTMTTHVPDGTSDAAVEDVRAREAAHSRDLAAEGHLLRLWPPPLQPGEWRTFGLFAAADRAELESVLLSMPLQVWRTDEVATLSPHPNDPAPQAQKAASSHTPPAGGEFF